jgi:RimJ/RimL family protein N-acetyltransferase
VLRPAYPLRTKRLMLRPYRFDDLDHLVAIQSRPEVARYLYWEPRNIDEVRAALAAKVAEGELTSEGTRLTLAAALDEAGAGLGPVVGEVSLLWLSSEHRQGELGYVFNPDYHGRGLATEAAEVILRLGFDELGLHRIIGRCDPRNAPSIRVMERLGMRREAHFVHGELFKGEWGEELVFAILEDEWRLGRPARHGTMGVS